MNVLVLANDPPYGTERCYNALRLAGSLAKRANTTVRVFLMADAVGCTVAGQPTPDGYYNLERMLKPVLRRGGEVACCGSCMDARGLTDERLAEGARRSTMEELTDWTLWADRVVTFSASANWVGTGTSPRSHSRSTGSGDGSADRTGRACRSQSRCRCSVRHKGERSG